MSADSILDKVISHQEDQQREDFDPVELVDLLFKELSEKEADIIRRRFGLGDQTRKETLETIGSEYKVTRERIRQIESQSISRIRQSSTFETHVRPVEHLVISLLEQHGGMMTKEMLYDQLLDLNKDDAKKQQSTSFIISQLLKDKVASVAKNAHFVPSWRLQYISADAVKAGIEALHSMVDTIGDPLSFDELYARFQETEYYSQNSTRLTEAVVEAYVEVSAKLGRNPFDEYGLAKWGSISPKRMNDRVMLVLRKEGEPMHFDEIAQSISSIFNKRAYPPTVHNELILNDEYVLVGRGIYALREWGYKEGVVADVVREVLARAERPLTRSEIVEHVLEQRIVKANTIHLALTDKKLFTKTKDGKYTVTPQTAETQEYGTPSA